MRCEHVGRNEKPANNVGREKALYRRWQKYQSTICLQQELIVNGNMNYIILVEDFSSVPTAIIDVYVREYTYFYCVWETFQGFLVVQYSSADR